MLWRRLKKRIFFKHRKKNEHDDAYLCHFPRYVCTPLQITFSQVCDWQTWQGRQTADSLSSFFIQPTAGQRFSLIFCHWVKYQAGGTPLNLSYSIISVRRWHNRPLKVILCPNLQDRVKNLPLVYRRQVGIHSGALQSKIQPKTKNRYSNGSKRKTSNDSA